jgi:hypothetical protein
VNSAEGVDGLGVDIARSNGSMKEGRIRHPVPGSNFVFSARFGVKMGGSVCVPRSAFSSLPVPVLLFCTGLSLPLVEYT